MSHLAFVTGATGFIGANIVRALLRHGHKVRALVRAGSDLSNIEGLPLELCQGDVRDSPESLATHLQGCDVLFHSAAYYDLWAPSPSLVYDVNVKGTRNVMEAALKTGVPRVVHTSSVATVRRPQKPGELADETYWPTLQQMPGHYERSKLLSEQEVLKLVQERGLPAVIVNPTAPVGFYDSRPTPTGRIIVDLLNGSMWGYVDGGMNIVDVEDVARGHILAAQKGRVGQRYILGGGNMTFRELFGLICELGGRKPPAVHVPYAVALLAAYLDEGIRSRLTGRRPRVPLAGVRLARQRMFFDSSKAVRELEFTASPVQEALRKAVIWLRWRRLLC